MWPECSSCLVSWIFWLWVDACEHFKAGLLLASIVRSKSFSQNGSIATLNYIVNVLCHGCYFMALCAFIPIHLPFLNEAGMLRGSDCWPPPTDRAGLLLCHFNWALATSSVYSWGTIISWKPELMVLSVHVALLPPTLTSRYGTGSASPTTNRSLTSLLPQGREPVEEFMEPEVP